MTTPIDWYYPRGGDVIRITRLQTGTTGQIEFILRSALIVKWAKRIYVRSDRAVLGGTETVEIHKQSLSMQTFPSVRRFLLCLLLGLQAGISDAVTLPEAIKGIDEVVPNMCRMLELERNMNSVIRESGQSPEQFFARSDTDPDPKVQQAIKIAKEIQSLRGEMTVALSKLKAVVATLKPEDQSSFNRQFELQLKKCSK